MSHHILHIFKHGCVLSKDRGFLVCRSDDKSENRIPHEDVRAVIIAARGVTLTSSFVSAILETDVHHLRPVSHAGRSRLSAKMPVP